MYQKVVEWLFQILGQVWQVDKVSQYMYLLSLDSTVILSLPLIQEGQLSVSGERMCTILVNRLED